MNVINVSTNTRTPAATSVQSQLSAATRMPDVVTSIRQLAGVTSVAPLESKQLLQINVASFADAYRLAAQLPPSILGFELLYSAPDTGEHQTGWGAGIG